MSQDESRADDPAAQPTEAVDSAVDWGVRFEPGSVLGDRYRIRSLLGAGGMGEVWHAFDLKLRVEVALKALRPELVRDGSRLDLLRSEVRAAREVASPNVCRIFDLVELDGTELVSMEYVDGTTLLEVLRDRAPLDPPEAQEIASQFLAGLEAIHEAGLVHRDIKPENIMVTRTGRVVVMDFGLARSSEEGAGTVSGTPAYMAPEQAQGVSDPRSDLFSAGVILAEMVSPEGIRDFESRESVWNGVRQEPPQIPDSPWAPVVKRAVAKDREERIQSASQLIRALEDVAFRVHDETGLEPYPGLCSFDEEDAEYFFGREAEVEAVWQKLQSSQLLGIIGASGSGKSSFLGAGLVPSVPDGWAIVRCNPGSAAAASLRRAVVSRTEEDAEAVRALASGGDEAVVEAFGAWRRENDHALLIVDQFEELFTQNNEEEQRRYTEILGQIALDAGVHVLLSMRDDFFVRCNQYERLRPMYSDVTVLDPPRGSGLRRAVVQPALRCGYRFEDEELADEVLAEVEGERGALPLLAFALARLWEKRDRENGLITRQAYRDIGGVGGALAGHAEAVMERLGRERHGIVREIFRNLVTAQGTRAAQDADELLSVFRDKPSDAAEVLHALIDARLLTSYEVPSDDGPGTQRVEVIHESLFTAWPRLVRWQAQDAEGALLRDQLRRAAATWDQRGRSDDLLWSGTAYREYQVWRERYPGGLTKVEDEFVKAMTSLATRRRRRRRIAVAATGVLLAAVATVLGMLWRQSMLEARRAEAGKLLALAQMQLDRDTTAALAYAGASLELADTPEARRLAVEVLWHAPVARILSVERNVQALGLPEDTSAIVPIVLSPDGRWLAAGNQSNRRVLLFPRDGGPPRALPRPPDGNTRVLAFGPRGDLLITGGSGESLRFWSLPDLREVRSADLGGLRSFGLVRDGRLLTFTQMREGSPERLLRAWPLPDGQPDALGALTFPGDVTALDPSGTTVAYGRGPTVRVRALNPAQPPGERVLGQGGDEVQDVNFSPKGDLLASLDRSGEIRVWSTVGGAAGPLRVLQGPKYSDSLTLFDPEGRLLTQAGPNLAVYLWDLEGPPDVQPLVLGRPGTGYFLLGTFGPAGQWLAISSGHDRIEFWPLQTPRARLLRGFASTIWHMAFTNDSRWLATCSMGEPARLWPLNAADGSARDLTAGEPCASLAMDPTGNRILVGTSDGKVLLTSSEGGPSRRLLDGWEAGFSWPVAFDRSGGRAFASPQGLPLKDAKQRVFRVWDLPSGQERVYSLAHLTDADWLGFSDAAFAPDGSLYVAGPGDLRRLVLPDEPGGAVSSETVYEAGCTLSSLSRDGRLLLVLATDRQGFAQRFEEVLLFDLERHTSRRITTHGARLSAALLDPSGRFIVTGDTEGDVRVGAITGEEPHQLLGHEGPVLGLAVSADGRWIASATEESVRLWPMPDLSKPPLHALPHEELMAKLDALTNLRVVRDPESPTGWTMEVGPFPGWAEVPEW